MVCERCYQDPQHGVHGWMKCPLAPRREESFSTPKDKRYEFVTTHVAPGTEIRSKGQWERFLRQRNLTTDLTPKEKMDMVTRGYAQKKRAEREGRLRRELQPILAQAFQQAH